MNISDELLEHDEFIQKLCERVRDEAIAKEIQETLVKYTKVRHPFLTELARKKAESLTNKEALRHTLEILFEARDEITARFILSVPLSLASQYMEEERLNMDVFDMLLEQDEFVQRQREKAYQEGLAIGRAEAGRTALIKFVEQRFPALQNLAEQQATKIEHAEAIRVIFRLVCSIDDEDIVRTILSSSAV